MGLFILAALAAAAGRLFGTRYRSFLWAGYQVRKEQLEIANVALLSTDGMRELRGLEASLLEFLQSCNAANCNGTTSDCIIIDDLANSFTEIRRQH